MKKHAFSVYTWFNWSILCLCGCRTSRGFTNLGGSRKWSRSSTGLTSAFKRRPNSRQLTSTAKSNYLSYLMYYNLCILRTTMSNLHVWQIDETVICMSLFAVTTPSTAKLSSTLATDSWTWWRAGRGQCTTPGYSGTLDCSERLRALTHPTVWSLGTLATRACPG